MKKFIYAIAAASLILSACVEVKGPEKNSSEPTPDVAEIQELTLFEANESYYFWDGEFLTLEQWQDVQAQELVPQKMDYEFVVGEMILGPDAILYTNGFNVRIHVQKLISDEALLSTFPVDQVAKQGQVGRSGGHILLNIKEGEGFLRVEMRGEQGGQGGHGAAPDKHLAGADGYSKVLPGGSGMFPKIGVVRPVKGKKGYPGQTGLKGGDSGTLEIYLPDTDRFNYRAMPFPGLGGIGGIGGAGGLGGCFSKQNCKGVNGKARIREDSGPKGDDGQMGPHGELQKICVIRDKNMTCY